MTALDRVLRYAPPSWLLRVALDQIRALQLLTEQQQATINSQRAELRAYVRHHIRPASVDGNAVTSAPSEASHSCECAHTRGRSNLSMEGQ